MKEICIILTHTNTTISKILKTISKKPYNHISISLTENCSTMYSFGRKIIWFPLVGGFVSENINRGVFKLHPETVCKIYKIEVSDEEYDIIIERINRFLENPDKFRYSFLNVFFMYFNIPLNRNYCYVCSSFVSHILLGIVPFQKELSLITPDDYNFMNLDKIYEGKLYDYVKSKIK